MKRGLFSEDYAVFEQGPPTVSLLHPLGVATFFDEYQHYIKKTHQPFQFGGQSPPVFFTRLLMMRTWLGQPHSLRAMQAAHFFKTLYQQSFPDYPLSRNAPARCVADVLLAISLESNDDTRQRLQATINDGIARMPSFQIGGEPVERQ